MPVLRERHTGSQVNVPQEKVAQVLALGYYDEVKDEKPAKKAAAKKSSNK